MSDPRLTADEFTYAIAMVRGGSRARLLGHDAAYRADVDRLTAERDALREERDEAIIRHAKAVARVNELEGPLYTITEPGGLKIGRPLVEVLQLDLTDCKAEHAALREELAKWRIGVDWGTGESVSVLVDAHDHGNCELCDRLERELAEASAEIARLHELLAEAGWTKEPR